MTCAARGESRYYQWLLRLTASIMDCVLLGVYACVASALSTTNAVYTHQMKSHFIVSLLPAASLLRAMRVSLNVQVRRALCTAWPRRKHMQAPRDSALQQIVDLCHEAVTPGDTTLDAPTEARLLDALGV